MDLLKGFFWASMVQQLLLLRILGEGSGLILLKERLAGRADNGLHVSL